MMRNPVLALLLVMAAAPPLFADAKADKAKAKQLYDDGLRHYNVAEYPEAIAAWKQAYLISKKPLLLFNVGQAYRLSGDCKMAMTFYESYQREEPAPKNQSDLDEALRLCAAKPVEKPVEKPAEKLVEKPVEKPVEPANPPVVVDKPVVVAPVVTAKPIETADSSTPTVGEPAAPPPEGKSSSGSKRTVGLVVGGAGVVMTGVGIYFGLSARSVNGELDAHTGEWTRRHVELESSVDRKVKFGIAFGAVGAAALITGGVLFAIGGPSTEHVAVSPTGDGAAFVWNGRF